MPDLPALKQTISQQLVFTDNIGQYGKTMDGYTGMGPIKFGYEGMNMPVLFTLKGLIHLQRKTEKISEKEERRLEKLGVPEDVIEKKKLITDRIITMEWVGINPDVKVIAEDVTTAYHTYGLIP